MALAPVILNTNPHRPVDFKESAVLKVFAESGSVAVECKEDGCQLNFIYVPKAPGRSQAVHLLSREGKAFPGLHLLAVELGNMDWSKFFEDEINYQTGATIKEPALFPEGFMLQAELTIDGMTCAQISGELRRKGHAAHLNPGFKIHGFDLIPLEAVQAEGEYEVFQNVRRIHTQLQLGHLRTFIPSIDFQLITSFEAYDMAHLDLIYEGFRKLLKEGAVGKDPLGYWKRGKKTGQWKIKPDDSCDGVVVGLMWGTPGLGNEGKVIGFRVLTEHGVEVDAGGITEAQKAEFTADELASPGCHMGWAVKITYMERLESGSYRHPNFDMFRGISDPMTKE
jgi:hypothetical protein